MSRTLPEYRWESTTPTVVRLQDGFGPITRGVRRLLDNRVHAAHEALDLVAGDARERERIADDGVEIGSRQPQTLVGRKVIEEVVRVGALLPHLEGDAHRVLLD